MEDGENLEPCNIVKISEYWNCCWQLIAMLYLCVIIYLLLRV